MADDVVTAAHLNEFWQKLEQVRQLGGPRNGQMVVRIGEVEVVVLIQRVEP